jgi:hypothetical protein
MKKISTILLATFFAAIAFSQSIFDNPITGVNPNTANPYSTGQNVNPNITVSGIGRGSGVTGANADNRYNASGWNSAALDANDYYEFTLTPNSGQAISFISLVFTLQSSATGPQNSNLALRSSVDGFTTTIATPTTAGTPGASNTIDLSAPQFQNISAAITFRIYAWAASGAGGTFSVNDFTFNGVAGVLPVRLDYFTGAKLTNAFSINWKANCSTGSNVSFDIERSNDGRNFLSINKFSASGVRCLQPFEYIDNNASAGKNFYRIKIIDENGKYFYSSAIALLNATDGFDIVGVLPTVVTGSSTLLNVTAAKRTQATVIITDAAGRKQSQQAYAIVAGSNQLLVNTAVLGAGLYTVTATTSTGQTSTVRFLKQ